MNAVTKSGKTIGDLLVDDRTRLIFEQLLPRHFTAERMVRMAMATVTRTPKLAECHPMTLLGAFVECAAIGLEPNSPMQHVHLLPFWNGKARVMEVNRIIGYRGFIELGRRTGQQVSLRADVIFERDEYRIEYGVPDDAFWHKPGLGAEDRGKPIAAYCYVRLADGGYAFQVLPWSDVLKARSRSFAYKQAEAKGWHNSPWHTDEDRMARKTAIRRLYGGGEAPMTIELAAAVAVDEKRMRYPALAQVAQEAADTVKDSIHMFAADDDEDIEERVVAEAPDPDAEVESVRDDQPEEPRKRRGRPPGSRNRPRHDNPSPPEADGSEASSEYDTEEWPPAQDQGPPQPSPDDDEPPLLRPGTMRR